MRLCRFCAIFYFLPKSIYFIMVTKEKRKQILYFIGGIIAILVIIGIIGHKSEQNIFQNTGQDVSALATTETDSVSSTLNTSEIKTSTVSLKYYFVTRVVDGDTIDVSIDGKVKRLRLIGINTPETVDPRKPVECFGVEASNKAKTLLTGKKVSLESDGSQGELDKYNRLLRYVFLEDGTNINLLMIKEGYAYEYTYNLPYKYQTEFKNAQKQAETNKAGLWSPNACNEDATKSASTNAIETSNANSCTIKGNISSSKEKIFHMIGCGSYNKTVIDESRGEKWFCSEKEAIDAGWRKALNCN